MDFDSIVALCKLNKLKKKEKNKFLLEDVGKIRESILFYFICCILEIE